MLPKKRKIRKKIFFDLNVKIKPMTITRLVKLMRKARVILFWREIVFFQKYCANWREIWKKIYKKKIFIIQPVAIDGNMQ